VARDSQGTKGEAVKRWTCGLTTVPERFDSLLPGTLASLQCAGFPPPRLFVDGVDNTATYERCRSIGLDFTIRSPRIRPYGNWALALAEMLIREPESDYYAVFQDDFTCYQNLRAYLESCTYPERGYWNLYTFPQNQALCPDASKVGWYPANQRGLGAVALVFDRQAVTMLLARNEMIARPYREAVPRRWKSLDGAVVTAMNAAGYREFVHHPSLVQHLGRYSTISNGRHPTAKSFRGESFDARQLLHEPRLDSVVKPIEAPAIVTPRKPSVGLLTPCFAFGGVERWTFELIQGLAATWRCEVGVTRGIRRSVFDGPLAALRTVAPVSVMATREVAAWAKRFDVIVAWGMTQLPSLIRGYRGGVIVCCHGEDVAWSQRYVDAARKIAHRFVAVSQAAMKPLRNVPAEKRVLIHNSVDASRCRASRPREAIRAEYGFGPDDFVCGYIGRLSTEKRIGLMAEAIQKLPANYRGLVVGNGATKMPLPVVGRRVLYRPYTTQIGDPLAAMDCVVGLCQAEGYWRVGMEAAVAGVPLVSTRVGVLREIAEEHGVLWQEVPLAASAEAVAASIRAVKERPDDARERAAKLKAVAEGFSIERCAAAWDRVLRSVIG